MSGGMNTFRTTLLALLLIATVIFALSLYFPAATLDRTCPGSTDLPASASPIAGMGNPPLGETTTDPGLFYVFGVFALLMGSTGAIGWIANPLIIFSAYLLLKNRKPILALKTSLLALTLAALSLYATNWLVLYGDEGGVCRSSAVAAHLGYWLWLSSIFLVTLGAAIATLSKVRDVA
jgi:hypothetical protein